LIKEGDKGMKIRITIHFVILVVGFIIIVLDALFGIIPSKFFIWFCLLFYMAVGFSMYKIINETKSKGGDDD